MQVRRDMRRRGWPRTSQGFNAHYHVYFQEDEDAGWVETPIRNLNMPGDTSDDTGGSSTDTADRTSSDEEYSNA